MGKRRTRKQKVEARHHLTVSWSPEKNEPRKATFEPIVNRQKAKDLSKKKVNSVNAMHSDYTGQFINVASIRKDIIKSLSIATFILASEVVLYLVWQKS